MLVADACWKVAPQLKLHVTGSKRKQRQAMSSPVQLSFVAIFFTYKSP